MLLRKEEEGAKRMRAAREALGRVQSATSSVKRHLVLVARVKKGVVGLGKWVGAA